MLKIVKCNCGTERATKKKVIKCNNCGELTCVNCGANSEGQFGVPEAQCPKCKAKRTSLRQVVKCRTCSCIYCIACGSFS